MYSISLEKAEPRSEEGVHKEGEETVIKLVDKEDLRKEREFPRCTNLLGIIAIATTKNFAEHPPGRPP